MLSLHFLKEKRGFGLLGKDLHPASSLRLVNSFKYHKRLIEAGKAPSYQLSYPLLLMRAESPHRSQSLLTMI